MRISNLSIGTRLGLSFGLVTLLAAVCGAGAYASLGTIESGWDDFSDRSLAKNELATKGKVKLGDAVQDFKNYVLRGKDYADKFRADLADIDEAANGYAKFNPSVREQTALGDVHRSVDAYRKGMDQLVKLRSNGASVEELDHAVSGIDKAIRVALDKLLSISNEETKAVGDKMDQTVVTGKRVIVGMTLVMIILAAVFSLVVTRSIVRPMRRAVGIAQAVAAGDLTTSIEARYNDETGQLLRALKGMNESLQRIVGEVRQGTDSMACAAQQIAVGNADLSSRTEEQAGALEETASSMEEMTTTVQENYQQAKLASMLAQGAASSATKGGVVVGDVVDTMAAISASSRKIVDIITVIDGIAFQTNILALNAAVEAARAGEQGRGFAVVAGEVRTLAHRSATAAKEIKVLIQESVSSIDVGAALVDRAGASIKDVVGEIDRVAAIVTEIADAAREQSASIEQVSEAIGQMDEMTQQNAALVEESAAAAESMKQRSTELSRLVNVFKLDKSAVEQRRQVVPLAQRQGMQSGQALRPAITQKVERRRA